MLPGERSGETEPSEPASAVVEMASPEEAARNLANPWVLLKVKALGELVPEAGLTLEQMIDEGRLPHEISFFLFQNHHVRLSDLEVGRYAAWLPRIRRDAIRKREQESEWLVQQARQAMGKHKPSTRQRVVPAVKSEMRQGRQQR